MASPVPPAPKTTMSSTRRSPRATIRPDSRAGVRRADDHDAVAGQDRLVAARHEHAAASDGLATFELAGMVAASSESPTTPRSRRSVPSPRPSRRFRQRDAAQVVSRAFLRDVELDDPQLPVGEDVGRSRSARRSSARPCRPSELGRDHEVDLNVTFLPGLDVPGLGGSDDRLSFGDLLDEHRRDEVDLVAEVQAIIREASTMRPPGDVPRAPLPATVWMS